ncbi:14526_t:CDS:2 [Funneliformis caledonium]|uniref:14526_t:CDS:1 n=1 Tax=Funneliformis caledonium TaxID=1117310 RepID=A0A9N9GR80_9GLOM|nr:14526_t:CDS:2 [Funneliformis caledonium]
MRPSTNTLTTNEPSEKDKEIDISEFTSFLEVVKSDYQYSCQTLQIVLDNLKIVITLQSQRDLDPMVRVKSGANILVQESKITRWWFQAKTAVSNNKGKENL